MRVSWGTALMQTVSLAAAAVGGLPPEQCALPGTDCRPDGPWPLMKCEELLNQTACVAARGTPQCNLEGCRTLPRCAWNSTMGRCADPPVQPPQPCHEILTPVDCVWSLGRDCRWAADGSCVAVPPAEDLPLPPCAADHTCAHNGMSETPPMGWRSWNVFAGDFDDSKMRAMVQALVDKSRMIDGTATSLAEVGYKSIGMDDGYQLCNCSGSHGQNDLYPHSLYNVSCSGDNAGQAANACRAGRCTWHNQSDGTPMIDTLKFPNLKGLVAHVHALGLQAGFYLNNCICMEKGRTYFEQDVAFMAQMGFDAVKIDQCGSAMNMTLWSALINATGRKMLIENCHNNPSWWNPGPDAARICDSNMWRSGGDIGGGFSGALSEAHQWFKLNNISSQHPWGSVPISRPGCWGYPDMMQIGNFCSDPPGENPRCEAEERSHMGLWCMMSSPLILGFNMSDTHRMDRVWSTITNREAIAVDHAWAGSPGRLHKTLMNGTIEIWTKPLTASKTAVLVLNTGDDTVAVKVSLSEDIPGCSGAVSYRSIWENKDIPIEGGYIAVTLGTHDNLFAVLSTKDN
eukprot:Hpha_TRINITY_DN22926_c0_g1::TRINITY_DN22926_c0_g1_i1::g.154059::m.154059/K07407/E3.2.1.22B, galA, rafA; alpha-galactosidase